MAEAIYLLCAATSLVTAVLLVRMYFRRRTPLLLWSSIGFLGLTLNNVLVYADLVLFKEIPLSTPRTLAGAAGILVLLFGLIWESDH